VRSLWQFLKKFGNFGNGSEKKDFFLYIIEWKKSERRNMAIDIGSLRICSTQKGLMDKLEMRAFLKALFEVATSPSYVKKH